MTTFVHCRGCGHQIHETAPTCPKCGAPQQVAPAARPLVSEPPISAIHQVPWFRRRWFVLACMLLFTPLGLLIAFTGDVYYEQKGELQTMPKQFRYTLLVIFIFVVLLNILKS